MAVLRKEELEKVLEALVDKMFEKGLLPPAFNNKEARAKIIANIVHTFNQNNIELTRENILDPKIQQGLRLAIVAELVATNKPELKFDYKILFLQKNPDDLKKELTEEITKLLKALNELRPNPDPKLEPNFKKEAAQIAEKLAEDIKPFERQVEADNRRTLNMFEELLLAYMVTLLNYSPSGKTPAITYGGTVTSLSNIANNEPAGPTGVLSLIQLNETQDLTRAGDKSYSIREFLGEGIDPKQLENLLGPQLKTPFDMKLQPPGSIPSK